MIILIIRYSVVFVVDVVEVVFVFFWFILRDIEDFRVSEFYSIVFLLFV